MRRIAASGSTSGEGALDGVVQGGRVGEAAGGKVGVLDVAPDGFDVTQLRAVGRQEGEFSSQLHPSGSAHYLSNLPREFASSGHLEQPPRPLPEVAEVHHDAITEGHAAIQQSYS